MKMLVYGKDKGSFENDSGQIVHYAKISALKFAEYVDQVSEGDRAVVGGVCNRFSCTANVFDLLPDDAESYDGGLLVNVDFDDRKKIVSLDLV